MLKPQKNLVVEGPPGTGKSQTITNIISELLVAGKSVLFVSEKMAALEVVKSRLDRVGLGPFCLELHSRKSNKKEILKELEKTIYTNSSSSVSLDDQFAELDNIKLDLNNYAKALRDPFGKIGFSPFYLFSMKDKAQKHFINKNNEMPIIAFDNLDNCGRTEWIAGIAALKDLANVLELVQPVSHHPWRGTTPDTILPSTENNIKSLLNDCTKDLDNLQANIESLVNLCAINKPDNLKSLEQAISAAKVISISRPVDKNVLLNTQWNSINDHAQKLINKIAAFQALRNALMQKFSDDSLYNESIEYYNDYKIATSKYFKFLNRKYWQIRKKVFSLYKNPPNGGDKQTISDLGQLVEFRDLLNFIKQSGQDGNALFGSHWRGEDSDPIILKAFSEWIVSFRGQLMNRVLADKSIDVICEGVSSEQIEELINLILKLSQDFLSKWRDLLGHLNTTCEILFSFSTEDVSFIQFLSRLKLWIGELPKIKRWATFANLHKTCLGTIAMPVANAIFDKPLAPEDLLSCFEGNFADGMLHLIFKQRPVLATFDGLLHERKIEHFQELDNILIEKNRSRITAILFQNRPHITGGASRGSEAGIILSEFNRKRGHMPIRKLMSLAGGLIQKIKPCFMMSPLSIAQFLYPRTALFDVIVFDEASQVKPEDALGALLRGQKVVVMGDTRQLPPTSFFEHITESAELENGDLEASVADIESILHQCKRCFPSKILRWHYRSKHESLIAVSNLEFYGNQLLIYPSPFHQSEQLGLQFVYLPHSIYDRGRSTTNRIEAKEVIKMAFEHYKNTPDKSLGVGTFNIKQQQAILEELELQLRLQPEMEELFKSSRDDHFFVKNLETIQGDERDVIFISVGYGFDEFRRLSLNFGPLNSSGGERRLNVLITRARERCVVFSNFRAIDLSLDERSPFGLQAFKVFLEYAENRILNCLEETEQETDSPFEDSVYDFLKDHNYQVRKQVGCAGFRVDLSVVDLEAPGRYLLGIECDGAKYHSSPVARDRDRLRQQILEGLGWKIHRIWSTDWYRNKEQTKNELLKSIENAKTDKGTPNVKKYHNSKPEDQSRFAETQTEKLDLDNPIEKEVIGYDTCFLSGFSISGDLHEKSVEFLIKLISKVVEAENPVHLDEVVKRIRSFWGLGRSGRRIHSKIEYAVSSAEKQKLFRRCDNFLCLKINECVSFVRRRTGDPPAKIEYICDGEIGNSVKLVLKYQHATLINDLIIQASRNLGIQATRSSTSDRINKVIVNLINKGVLKQMPNGMIHFA